MGGGRRMKDKEVLQKAIGIAEDNDSNYECDGYDRLTALLPLSDEIDYRGIIFSHSFAKAFWGDKVLPYDFDWDKSPSIVEWKYHLQQMVLEENPINYLRKFIENEK